MGWIRGAMIESILAALGAVGLLLSFLLIYLARRGRRIDDHPLCRKCGYDLTGRAEGSDCCAECGADLSRRRAIRVGNCTPRRPLFWAGLCITAFFLVLTGAVGWLQFSHIDLMQHKPVWLLRSDASSLLWNKRVPAVTELTRRFTAGELTDAQIQAIVSDALVLQADPAFPWKDWDSLVWDLVQGGAIGDTDWLTLSRQGTRLTLMMRPRIRAGDRIPITLAFDTARIPRTGIPVNRLPPMIEAVKFEQVDAVISGLKVAEVGMQVENDPGIPGMDPVRALLVTEAQTAALAPGLHRLTCRVSVSVLQPKTNNKVISSFISSVYADLTILPASTDPKQLFSSDPPSANEMMNSIRSVRVTRAVLGSTKYVTHFMQMDVTSAPAGLLHQAYLRTTDGKEFAIGSITFENRYSGRKSRSVTDLGQASSVDVILRPDFELLKNSIRSDRIWGEEIVFRGIKVMPPDTPVRGSGSRPSTTPRPGG